MKDWNVAPAGEEALLVVEREGFYVRGCVCVRCRG